MARTKKTNTEKVSVRERLANKRREEQSKRLELIKKLNSGDVMVDLMSNYEGDFNYRCETTNISFDLHEIGQIEPVPFETLRIMANRHKKALEKYYVIPISIYGADEIELEDVLELLGIDNLYSDEMLSEGCLDELILDTDVSEFKEILNDFNSNYIKRLAERALHLISEGKLTDGYKERILKKYVNGFDEGLEIIDEELDKEFEKENK